MKENKEDRIWMLVTRSLSNEADESEMQELEQWLKEDEQNRKEFENIKAIWKFSSQKEEVLFSDDNAWERLRKRIIVNPSNEKITRKIILPSVLRMAAAILFIMVLAFAARYIISSQKFTKITAKQKMISNPVILPDGTTVYLNAGSTIIYPKKFKNSVRSIEIIGEAFFNVTRNEKSPFIIKTRHAHVKVLGTSFNLLAYPATDSIQVAVESGIVELSSGDGKNTIQLTKGISGAYYNSTGKIIKSQNDINGFAWFTNRIFFNNSELPYITRTLERIFNKHIEINIDNIKNCRLTADFKDKDISKILEAIKTSLNLNIKETSKGYILTGKGC